MNFSFSYSLCVVSWELIFIHTHTHTHSHTQTHTLFPSISGFRWFSISLCPSLAYPRKALWISNLFFQTREPKTTIGLDCSTSKLLVHFIALHSWTKGNCCCCCPTAFDWLGLRTKLTHLGLVHHHHHHHHQQQQLLCWSATMAKYENPVLLFAVPES